MISNIGNPAIDPTVVRVSSTPAQMDWGTPEYSYGGGFGVPSGDLGSVYYFDIGSPSFDLYQWDGATWSGPLVYVYSTEAANADWPTTDPATHWVTGNNGDASGGIYGPRTVTVPASPANGDTITYNAATGQWVATTP